MGKRRKSRELALQQLFKEDLNPNSGDVFNLAEEHEISDEVKDFYKELVQGVTSKKLDIDRLIEEHSNNWRVSRMAKVDLNIIRMATYELLYSSEVPPNVALNEAIEISKKFGSEDSPSFVNGILDNILKKGQA
ncbi:MAG: transcription antitermination factor NusB [Deltaproteobacteria bacterium RIFCSPHIGHO2_12_FULL_43_9]|nr:MAG: transcription antitermination factor NusB [Deltaproteobacteria bacterium RIFCSPHIGHO2_12_FULL_43_9]